jgi:hypothetical protein
LSKISIEYDLTESEISYKIFEVKTKTVCVLCVNGFLFCDKMENKMTDEEFYKQFETGTLDVNIFNHANHVKIAWVYLRKFNLPNAMSKFTNDLKNFATANGATNLYHETITFAYLILINERLQKTENQSNWEDFVKNYPELFDWKENILKNYYKEATLKTDFAKKNFVFPDKKL